MIEKHFHDVFYNGKSLADFGVHVSGDGTFNSPEKDYETVEVPGRNGDLHIFNERFKNVDLTYKAFIIGDSWPTSRPNKDFRLEMQGLRAWLLGNTGYKRLEDTYHPDEYRMALFKGPIETEAILLQAGEFDLTFNCKPQRFLKSGESSVQISTNEYLYNPTMFSARPAIRVYGHGTVIFEYENGDQSWITVLDNPHPYIDIDSEMSDAYYETNNCNSYIALSDLSFPVLQPGVTRITRSVTFNKVELTPRWWTI